MFYIGLSVHSGEGVCIAERGGGGWADPTPELEKQVVHILLECFLVGEKILQCLLVMSI